VSLFRKAKGHSKIKTVVSLIGKKKRKQKEGEMYGGKRQRVR
jgi:hypothetical protein